ncbi:MAG: uroporphyrinogen decarboxylase family protein [bacterium]|jgi:uroporphyrinogen decarboxylase|nr:uroporphyrinogen decarboxylase family protein [bacterium]
MKIPFTPAVYEHAARFVERSPWEVSRDPDLLFEAHKRAFLTYYHSPVVVGIDIYNIETEAYGAEICNPGGNGIPAIHTPLFSTLDEAMAIRPYDPRRDGRIPMMLGVAQRLKEALPEADVRLPVAGPFSLAFNLRGISNLCEDVALRPQDAAAFLMRLAENQAVFFQTIVEAGLDIAFFESAASPPMLSPRLFREVELPALQRELDLGAQAAGHPIPCIMGGDTYLILDDILSTGTKFVVCNVETNQEAFVQRALATHPEVKIRVNMDAGILSEGNQEKIHREIDRILAITKDHPNCLLGTGCLPYETPPQTIQWIKDYIV